MSDDIIAISAAEYKAILGMSTKMAETIESTQEQNRVLQDAVKVMVSRQTDLIAAIHDLFDALKITVNVPDLPAPVINNLPSAAKSRRYDFIREGGVIIGIQEVEND